jgi:anti-anti-sigma regulatory factor
VAGGDESNAGGTVNVLAVGEATVLELVGAFDSDRGHTLMAAIDAAIDAERPIVVDLSRVTQLLAVTLGVLFYGNTQASKRGVAIGFVPPPGAGRVAFDLAGVEQHLPVYESRADTLRAVTGAQ